MCALEWGVRSTVILWAMMGGEIEVRNSVSSVNWNIGSMELWWWWKTFMRSVFKHTMIVVWVPFLKVQ